MNAIIGAHWPVPLLVIPLVGGLAGLAFAILLGWISARRGGMVFSMITLGIAELVGSLSLILRTFFGGEDGIETNRTKLLPLFGYKFGPQVEIYYVIAAWCFVSAVLMYLFTKTPLGRMCGAVRDNPERAEFVGYDATRVRYLVMCLSGFFAGVAGALATMNFELTNASMLGAAQSANVLLATYIGGVGFFWGPIVGAAIVTLLQFWLSDYTDAWMLYFGLLFVLIVMFVPDGVAGWFHRHMALARNGRIGALAGPYALVAPAFVLAFAGGVMLIELAHHALVRNPSDGGAMSAFGVSFSDVSPIAWAAALLVFLSGVAGVTVVWPRVIEAWSRASATPGEGAQG